MNDLIEHRGPDDDGLWTHERGHVGFGHRRLAIIDPTPAGHQPMRDAAGRWITYNGEVYNYPELRLELGGDFRTGCDTEVVMRAHDRWGVDSLDHLRGMFAYALWDEVEQELLCARDRFGIKPFYYAQVGDVLYFASEAKALLPFLPRIETDLDGLKDYLAFQFCLAGKTLFEGVRELQPGHRLRVRGGTVAPGALLGGLLRARLGPHRDVLRGADRGAPRRIGEAAPPQRRAGRGLPQRRPGLIERRLARQPRRGRAAMKAFTGRFPEDARYDESEYAQALADERGLDLRLVDIGADDFLGSIERVIYHLDHPVAGPGSFPQYMVSQAAAREAKVILGGQGGDEIFGGYTRYLIAYFEQCVKAAIDGTMRGGNFVVTYESIIPNLVALRNYKPLLKEFWSDGLFEDLDARYFRLINRAPHLSGEVDFAALGTYSPFDSFQDDLQRPQRGPRVLLRQDDALRLQDAPAGAAAGRGPREHGAQPGVARAAARSRAGRAGGHDAGRRQVQGRHDEARLQAGHAVARAGRDCRPQGQDGLPRTAARVVRRAGSRVHQRRVLVGRRSRPRAL